MFLARLSTLENLEELPHSEGAGLIRAGGGVRGREGGRECRKSSFEVVRGGGTGRAIAGRGQFSWLQPLSRVHLTIELGGI